jgi:hypothetical protein
MYDTERWNSFAVETSGESSLARAIFDDMLQKLDCNLKGPIFTNIIHLFLTGPNVNGKMFKSLKQDLKSQSIPFSECWQPNLLQAFAAFQNKCKCVKLGSQPSHAELLLAIQRYFYQNGQPCYGNCVK